MKRLLTTLLLAALASPAMACPVTVDSCGTLVTFEAAPGRMVVHDINMADMAFALGLQDRMVGVTGISGWYKTSAEFDERPPGALRCGERGRDVALAQQDLLRRSGGSSFRLARSHGAIRFRLAHSGWRWASRPGRLVALAPSVAPRAACRAGRRAPMEKKAARHGQPKRG